MLWYILPNIVIVYATFYSKIAEQSLSLFYFVCEYNSLLNKQLQSSLLILHVWPFYDDYPNKPRFVLKMFL